VARSAAIRRFRDQLGSRSPPGATFAEQSTELSLINLFELSSLMISYQLAQ
jgi:hypothetical protein